MLGELGAVSSVPIERFACLIAPVLRRKQSSTYVNVDVYVHAFESGAMHLARDWCAHRAQALTDAHVQVHGDMNQSVICFDFGDETVMSRRRNLGSQRVVL